MSETAPKHLPKGDEISIQEQPISPPVSSCPSIRSPASPCNIYQDTAPPRGDNITLQTLSQTRSSQINSSERNGNLAHEDGEFERLIAKLQSKLSTTEYKEPTSWWWWEILAISLSTICMCGLVGVLTKIHERPLESWQFRFQPNSVIAMLITTGKALMMFVVASSISQLKWRHFMIRSRRLIDLQIYDSASRGPWGSVVLLWKLCVLRVRALAAFGFALITIFSLGMDTSAQQVLKFPSRESLLRNVTTELGISDSYTSKASKQEADLRGHSQTKANISSSLQYALISGAAGTTFKQSFTCPQPASRCEWSEFTTLGLCGTIVNSTDSAVEHCGPLEDHITYCNYSIPGIPVGDNSEGYYNMIESWAAVADGHYLIDGTTGEEELTTFFMSQFLPVSDPSKPTALLGYFMAVKAPADIYPTYNPATKELDLPPVSVYSGTISWCARRYGNVTSSHTSLNEALVSMENLTYSGLRMLDDGGEELQLVADSTSSTYRVNWRDSLKLADHLDDLLTFTISFGEVFGSDAFLDIGSFLQHSNLTEVFIDIANALTTQLRESNGDNYNASTIKGKAFFEEPYMHVRWWWITLPLAEVLLTVILLAVSINITRRQPLLRQSAMALLASGLEGWSQDELNILGAQSREKLDELAEKLVARLEIDDLGRLRFQRG